jgi:hemin uptake protein HemP
MPECGTNYKIEQVAICEECFGPLEVDYDYAGVKQELTREVIASRPKTLWRYKELLPLDGDPVVGLDTDARRLSKLTGSPSARCRRALRQERRRLASDTLIQGQGCCGCPLEGARIRLRDRRLRVDGQPGQCGCGKRSRSWLRSLHTDPG